MPCVVAGAADDDSGFELVGADGGSFTAMRGEADFCANFVVRGAAVPVDPDDFALVGDGLAFGASCFSPADCCFCCGCATEPGPGPACPGPAGPTAGEARRAVGGEAKLIHVRAFVSGDRNSQPIRTAAVNTSVAWFLAVEHTSRYCTAPI